MSRFAIRSDRLATLRERARRPPGHEEELAVHIKAASPERLLECNPMAAAHGTDGVNMATVYRASTDGC